MIDDKYFDLIWEWLPSNMKMYDGKRIWSSYENGVSLLHLYNITLDYFGRSFIFLI